MQIYWDRGMELATGYSAREAVGKDPVQVFGFERNELVRRSQFYMLKNTPPFQYVVTTELHMAITYFLFFSVRDSCKHLQ
jgi:hypothetical protein